MIPDSFITELLARTDIVEVVGRYVKLQKKGVNWMACCPFHKEKTPSFAVNQGKQFFKCFGCGKAGSAIGFLMEFKGLSFPEAVAELAQAAGMTVPEDRQAAATRKRNLTLFEITGRAAAFYAAKLEQSETALSYLEGRGIGKDAREKFRLGYSPEGWRSLSDAFASDYASRGLEDTGLVIVKDSSRYDRFRGRVMFPIRNLRGQVIGFGARTMVPDEEPKYLNSPETEIYHKGHELYGLYEAREAIRASGRAIVCEGYMDVIQMSQGGFPETVAALGTSITSEHVKKLFALTDAVYFSFDGDEAGFKAADRALHSALSVIGDVQKAFFVILPQGEDPDSIVRDGGTEAFERQIRQARPLSRYFVLSILRSAAGGAVRSSEDRSACLAAAVPLLQSMKAKALREMLLMELASAISVSPEQAARVCGISLSAGMTPVRTSSAGYGRDAGQSERFKRPVRMITAGRVTRSRGKRLLQCLLINPSWFFAFAEDILAFESSDDSYGRLACAILSRLGSVFDESRRDEVTVGALLTLLQEDTSLPTVTALMDEESRLQTPEDVALKEIETAFAEEALERNKLAISQATALGDAQALAKLLAQQKRLLAKLADMKARSVEEAFRSRT